MHVLMIFFDGVGLGANDPAINPFLSAPMPTWRGLFNGAMPVHGNGHFDSPWATLVPTDATLGIAGLPQSATGQTTLFTGVNAAREIGEHLGPYPNAALRGILSHENLFQRLVAAKRRVAFANAYPPVFFDRLARNKARRSATSYAVQAAGVRYRDIDDLRSGNAVSAFVTNDRWRYLPTAETEVPLITARQAGRNLAHIARTNDFTLFEYFLTDAAGHKSNPALTRRVLDEIDELLAGVFDGTDLSDTLIVITSDHGNVEDASTRLHTLNQVPTILVGAERARVAPLIRSLTDLTPAIAGLALE